EGRNSLSRPRRHRPRLGQPDRPLRASLRPQGPKPSPRNGRDRPEKAAGKAGGEGRAGCPDEPSNAAGGLLRATPSERAALRQGRGPAPGTVRQQRSPLAPCPEANPPPHCRFGGRGLTHVQRTSTKKPPQP